MRRLSVILIVAISLLSGPAVLADGVTPSAVQQFLSGVSLGITGARADVAVAPDGRTMVVWANQTAFTFEIWYAVLDAEGVLIVAPTSLFSPPPAGLMGAPRSVKVAVTSQRFMIVWDAQNASSPGGFDYDIWFHILDLNGVPQLPAPLPASTSSFSTEQDPDCAGSLGGIFYLTWVRYGAIPGSAGEGIYVRRFDETGTAFDVTEVRVDDPNAFFGYQRATAVTVWPSERFVVTWQDGQPGLLGSSSTSPDASGTAILARWFDFNLVPTSLTNVLINSFWLGDQQEPEVSADFDDRCVFAWSGPGLSGSLNVCFRRFTSTGFPVDATDIHVPPSSTGNLHLDAVAMTPSGEFVLAWSEEPAWSTCSAAASNEARIARYTYDAALIETFACEDISAGAPSQARPGMALDQYGNIRVAYESCLPGSAFVDLNYRRFSRQMITFSNDSPRVGKSVNITLDSPSDVFHLHILLVSLGTGPMVLNNRRLELSPDLLFGFTLNNQGGGLLTGATWFLGANGISTAPRISIPNDPLFSGWTFHFAFVAGLTEINTISDTYSLTVQ